MWYTNPAPQVKKNRFFTRKRPEKRWKLALKTRDFDRFYVFTSKTYGKSRSVGRFTALPTDRAQNLVLSWVQTHDCVSPDVHRRNPPW